MSSEREFIFISYHRDLNTIMTDLNKDDRVTYFFEGSTKKLNNHVLTALRNIHFSNLINIRMGIHLPFKSIWGLNLKHVHWKKGVRYYVVFVSDELWPTPIAYLNDLRLKYDVTYVMLYLDTIANSHMKSSEYYLNNLQPDLIFSFQKTDCIKYGFRFMFTPYSLDACTLQNSNEIEYDLYFCGNKKGRLNILYDIYARSLNANVSFKLRITDLTKNEHKFRDILSGSYLPYCSMTREMSYCNCLLEVLSQDQFSPSLRYYEAVCYNKKLLTNNLDVVNLPFYDPNYIHVFEKPEDIDWNWVKDRSCAINYHYDGLFSPIHLIDNIIEAENVKEGNPLVKDDTP